MLDSIDTLIAFTLIFAVVSLLITILVQIVTSLFNLRGHNLAWGVAEAFEAIAPELKAKAAEGGKKLADGLLKDFLISDSQFFAWRGKATAVRADELFALLHQIAIGKREIGKTGEQASLRADAVALFKSLGVPNSVFEIGAEEKRKMEELRDDLKKQLTGLPDGAAKSELQKTLAEIEASLVGAAQTADEAALRWVALGEQKIQEIYSKFSHWFEIGQERSQEWFTTHARLITAILGLFAAFALQLDTVEIYKLVSSNRELRDKLVAQTDNVIEQGEKVLKDRPAVLQQAINSMSQVELGTNLSRVAVAPSDTLEMVKARIRENCTNCSPADLEKLLASFDEQTVNVVKTNLAEYSKEYKGMATSLDKSGFELFPKAGWRWEHKESDCWNYFFGSKHTVGMLFSALLLSLGAPFWFNTLKSLASLRSTVAKNIADEEKAEVKSKANQKAANPDQIEKAPATAK